MLDTAAVSLELRNPLESEGWDPKAVALIVALHDIGKADSVFQHQIPDLSDALANAGFQRTTDAKCRHERISARFLRTALEATTSERNADTIGRCILAHHGYWCEHGRDAYGAYHDAQLAIQRLLERTIGASLSDAPDITNHSAFGMRLCGHIVLCDWIASNDAFFTDKRLQDIDDPARYLDEARKVAREWVRNLKLGRTRRKAKPSNIVANPRPLQRVILDEDIPPGLAIIEAPMGEGKTEAAWMLAEKWVAQGFTGMYMALPTMATSDALHQRYREHYLRKLGEDPDARLVHGMAWLRDNLEPESPPNTGELGDDQASAAAWFRPTRRAMLAAHGIGTVDQAMLAGMNVKFGFLRLFGLDKRVLVIDEVHAYDAYMSAIICRLLQWCACLEIPVIMLSATLSSNQRQRMVEAYAGMEGPWSTGETQTDGSAVPYPLITAVPARGAPIRSIRADASSSRTLQFRTHTGKLGDAAATAKEALALVANGGCCCVILNTVKQAQAVYGALADLPKDQKLLFHARFTATDREKIARRVSDLFGKESTNRPAKFVLVATQVVEQSLDVDFDHMITEIAPMDLLLQRSGRLHRHRIRKPGPVLHVLLPPPGSSEFGGTGYVYADKPLLRTVALLCARPEATLPNDFRILIECTYGETTWESLNTDWDAIAKADQDWDRALALMQEQGKQFCLNEPSRRMFRPVNNDPTGDESDDGNGWRAKTRLGANDRTAILVAPDELRRLTEGRLSTREVKMVYRRAVKIARYLPLHRPAEGYSPAVEASDRMRGIMLLPVDVDGVWRGSDDKGNAYQVSYDHELGLLAGRVG